jgi:hypothetical protein
MIAMNNVIVVIGAGSLLAEKALQDGLALRRDCASTTAIDSQTEQA